MNIARLKGCFSDKIAKLADYKWYSLQLRLCSSRSVVILSGSDNNDG